MLWLINTSVFWPRGLALVLHDDDHGTVTGWSVTGAGDAPIRADDDLAQRRFSTADLFLLQTRRRNVLDGSPVDVAEIRRIVDHDPGYVLTREEVRTIGGTPPSFLLGVLRMDGGPDAHPDDEVQAVAERAREVFAHPSGRSTNLPEHLPGYRITELPEHLRPDAPVAQCYGCHRETTISREFGQPCRMPQPDGSTCSGRFGYPVRIGGLTVPREMVEGPAALPRPEDLSCPAHGVPNCRMCSRNPSTCTTGATMADRGCEYYASAGVHWDTCPNRDRSELIDVPERVDQLPPLGDVEHDRAADQ